MTDERQERHDAESYDVDPTSEAPEEVVPDYSRVGFRGLQALCKERGIPGDGNSAALIEKLKAWDAQHGKDVDLTAAEDIDLLADDEDTPERPAGAGEAASASAPVGDLPDLAKGAITYPDGGTVTSAAPAVVVYSDPDQSSGLPAATNRAGKPDLSVRTGLVRVGQGHGAAEVRAYRLELPHGPREITDNDHFAYIAETHAAAQAAGHVTKGGVTVGERVGYATDADGRRTVIYQVPLKRQQ